MQNYFKLAHFRKFTECVENCLELLFRAKKKSFECKRLKFKKFQIFVSLQLLKFK